MPRPGPHILPLLAFAAILLFIVSVFVGRQLKRTRIRHQPLTSKEVFLNHHAGIVPRDPSRLWLTASGRVARTFAIGFGLVWVTLSGMVVYAALTRPTPSVTVVLPLLFIGLLAFVPAYSLRRDYRLLKSGQMTSGLVVGVVTSSGRTLSRSVYYDFMIDQGEVLRGRSIDNSPLGVYSVGSFESVFYLPGHPQVNALKQCLCWRERWAI